jgi:hypothetical protein
VRALLRPLLDRLWPGRRGLVYVVLTYAEGPPGRPLGPMTRYAAEVLIVTSVSPAAAYQSRRVTSARIVSA